MPAPGISNAQHDYALSCDPSSAPVSDATGVPARASERTLSRTVAYLPEKSGVFSCIHAIDRRDTDTCALYPHASRRAHARCIRSPHTSRHTMTRRAKIERGCSDFVAFTNKRINTYSALYIEWRRMRLCTGDARIQPNTNNGTTTR